MVSFPLHLFFLIRNPLVEPRQVAVGKGKTKVQIL